MSEDEIGVGESRTPTRSSTFVGESASNRAEELEWNASADIDLSSCSLFDISDIG